MNISLRDLSETRVRLVISVQFLIIFHSCTASPTLEPYPDLATNNIHSPDGLVSIFRVRIDACDRMWGLDTGVDDILGDAKVVRPMRLIVIDLKTNMVPSQTLRATLPL